MRSTAHIVRYWLSGSTRWRRSALRTEIRSCLSGKGSTWKSRPNSRNDDARQSGLCLLPW